MLNRRLISMDNKYGPSAGYLLLLLLITVIGCWPLSFHVFSLKNDALNYFLPVRHLVSEAYYHHELPLWTPYMNLGYPLHGDMQSGVWNPLVQLLSLFGPYTLYTLQIETLLYIYLSGVSMFFLLKYCRVHPHAAIMGSVAYMLCGFNIDSCQFLNWIAGAAFLPFVFLSYYRCLTEQSVRQGIYAGFAVYHLFSCAYPADFIITAYLLLAVFLTTIIGSLIRREKIKWRSLFLSHGSMVLLFLLLSAPAILSYAESLPLQERGNGASYEQVMSNSLHPILLSSFTTPLSVWKMPGMEMTDPLERNSWIGLTAFIFLLAGYFVKQDHRLARFAKWSIVVFLLFSFGEWGGLRILSYYVLPLMNSFRHPANAKMFTLFFACLLGAFTYSRFIQGAIPVEKIKKAWYLSFGFFLLVLGIALFFPIHLFQPAQLASFFSNQPGSVVNRIKNLTDGVSFADLVILCSLIQLPFWWALYRFSTRKRYVYLLLTALVNCMLFAMLLQPFTVIKKDRAAYIQQVVNQNTVAGYPLPDIHRSLRELSAGNEDQMAEIGCRCLYNKIPGRSDYRITPSNLLIQNDFWFNEPFREYILNYPVLYSAQYLDDIERWNAVAQDTLSRYAFTSGLKVPHRFSNPDSVELHLTMFKPGLIEGTVKSPDYTWLVLLQSYYPRWALYVDGKKEVIEKTNISFMGFQTNKGAHHFSFRYEARDLLWALRLNLLTMAFFLVYWLAGLRRRIIP